MPEDLKVLYHDEVQLLDYGESRTRGKYVLFRLSENGEDPLAVFRGLDVGTKIQAGHIFNLTLTQGDILAAPYEKPVGDTLEKIGENLQAISDARLDKQEEPELKGGKLSREAALMIKHANFHRYLMAIDTIKAGNDTERFEAIADAFLKWHCGIESKRELDHNPKAADAYRSLCKKYGAWIRGSSV